jgi:hypothetical protein
VHEHIAAIDAKLALAAEPFVIEPPGPGRAFDPAAIRIDSKAAS